MSSLLSSISLLRLFLNSTWRITNQAQHRLLSMPVYKHKWTTASNHIFSKQLDHNWNSFFQTLCKYSYGIMIGLKKMYYWGWQNCHWLRFYSNHLEKVKKHMCSLLMFGCQSTKLINLKILLKKLVHWELLHICRILDPLPCSNKKDSILKILLTKNKSLLILSNSHSLAETYCHHKNTVQI